MKYPYMTPKLFLIYLGNDTVANGSGVFDPSQTGEDEYEYPWD